MDRIKYYLLLSLVTMMPVGFTACSDSDDGPTNPAEQGAFDIDFELPAAITAAKGHDVAFTVVNGKAPLTSDIMLLESGGLSYQAAITSADTQQFTVALPSGLKSGTYTVIIKRGDRRKNFGQTAITMVDCIISPAEGSTVYGFIGTPDGQPVANVLVSDGAEFAATNSEGIYQLQSKKPYGYVFYVLPSGYEAQSDGVLPRIYTTTKLADNLAERIDFTLQPVGSQENYKVLFLGDMHLANRTNDRAQFTDICTDINKYRAAHSGEKIFAITLGDMTWDLYWYSKKYALPEYLKDVNAQFTGIQFFHTMGNHDNDMNGTNNMIAKAPYRNVIAPNFYSFNIGKVHYVVLDDIDCSTYDGTESRNYVQQITNEQIAWLNKDLSYVDKSTPVVVTMHAPVFYPSGATNVRYDLKNHAELLGALAGYNVHLVTGHTHKNYNITPDNNLGNGNIYEHNVGAVCSDWWWSGNLTPGCLTSTDGTPAGYQVWDIKGDKFEYIYKVSEQDENVQFRSYDINNVKFTTDGKKAGFKKYADAYPGTANNNVLINVWNYNPSWTITVTTEGGQSLAVKAVTAYDPIHIAAQTEKRYATSESPSFSTQSFTHFFQVTAPDADTDLVITVKDEFGHVWVENMARPKAFSTAAYSVKK